MLSPVSVVVREASGNYDGAITKTVCCVCGSGMYVKSDDLRLALSERGQFRCYCDACLPSSDLKVPALCSWGSPEEVAKARPLERHEGTIALHVEPEYVHLLFDKEKTAMPVKMSDEEKIREAQNYIASISEPMRLPTPRQSSQHQQRVEKFMLLAEQAVPGCPTIPDEKTRLLRAKLMFEETLETIRLGLGVNIFGRYEHGTESDGAILITENNVFFVPAPERAPDLEQIADGCFDVAVVTTGTLSACGMADELGQFLVDKANLEKFNGGGYKREDGKWIKGPSWKKPDLTKVITKQ